MNYRLRFLFPIKKTIEKSILRRPCDTDTYFRNIIFSNICEILFMCITDYFKLFSRSCAIKTLSKEFEFV